MVRPWLPKLEINLLMRILTLDNVAYEINEIPDEINDLRFAVLDNSDPRNPDYFYIPLIFLESFNSPALVLRIGEHVIKMPVDWQVLIGEPDVGDLEVIPLTSINDRGYQDVKWYFPKLRPGQLLAIPLETNVQKPRCAYFVKEISRQSEIVDYGKCW